MRKEDPKAPLVGILSGESPTLPMMYKATIPTWDLLRCLGFQSDSAVISDVSPGLSFDFGNLKLSASCVWSPRSGEVILFSGIVSTPRTLGEVDFELPRRIKSLKRCAAWIVWNLDQHLAFKQTCHIDSLDLILKNEGNAPANPSQIHVLVPEDTNFELSPIPPVPEYEEPLKPATRTMSYAVPLVPVGKTLRIHANIWAPKGHASFIAAFTITTPQLKAVTPLGSLTILPPKP